MFFKLIVGRFFSAFSIFKPQSWQVLVAIQTDSRFGNPSNSHHQDYEPFLIGNPNLNLHFISTISGGTTQLILLMVQNSGKPVEVGSFYPIIYRVLAPSQVGIF